MITLEAQSVRYLSKLDEDAFFVWLKQIQSVRRVDGVAQTLFLEIDDNITDEELRELIALFHRYNVSMTQLAALLTPSNASWFRDKPEMYWHAAIWSDTSV